MFPLVLTASAGSSTTPSSFFDTLFHNILQWSFALFLLLLSLLFLWFIVWKLILSQIPFFQEIFGLVKKKKKKTTPEWRIKPVVAASTGNGNSNVGSRRSSMSVSSIIPVSMGQRGSISMAPGNLIINNNITNSGTNTPNPGLTHRASVTAVPPSNSSPPSTAASSSSSGPIFSTSSTPGIRAVPPSTRVVTGHKN